MSIYDELGVPRLINVSTTLTMFGGSKMPPEVLDAMRDAASSYVDMHQLHEVVGAELARITRNEAAYVTAGCAAGIVLAILGCRTGGDPGKIANIADDPAIPDEVIMHTAHRFPYDPAVRLAGARIRQIGNVKQTFEWELESAISDRTAAVLYVAGSRYAMGAMPLTDVIRIAHSRNVPVLVDAAAQAPPVANLWRFTSDLGADIAVFSGGKELKGPQASGLMVGRQSFVAAARANGAPHQRFARAMKVGKEEIAGLLAAVRRYLILDHAAEQQKCYELCREWEAMLAPLPGVRVAVEDMNAAGADLPRVRVDIDSTIIGCDATELAESLRKGDPGVAVSPGLHGTCFYMEPALLEEGEFELVSERVATELQSGG